MWKSPLGLNCPYRLHLENLVEGVMKPNSCPWFAAFAGIVLTLSGCSDEALEDLEGSVVPPSEVVEPSTVGDGVVDTPVIPDEPVEDLVLTLGERELRPGPLPAGISEIAVDGPLPAGAITLRAAGGEAVVPSASLWTLAAE